MEAHAIIMNPPSHLCVCVDLLFSRLLWPREEAGWRLPKTTAVPLGTRTPSFRLQHVLPLLPLLPFLGRISMCVRACVCLCVCLSSCTHAETRKISVVTHSCNSGVEVRGFVYMFFFFFDVVANEMTVCHHGCATQVALCCTKKKRKNR